MLDAACGTYTWLSSKDKALKLDRTREDVSALVGLCCQNGYNPSANTDFRKQEKVISDLLDGKDAEIILEEIREELLRNAK